ncbi:hypothetical protein Fmac_026638 [Flemingia macrophylla]|uniref:Uncharacterized protein n=1 Tax=Flemingia macrophylla TaxID=520843 RepID=A0ABD1LFF9_9FABA
MNSLIFFSSLDDYITFFNNFSHYFNPSPPSYLYSEFLSGAIALVITLHGSVGSWNDLIFNDLILSTDFPFYPKGVDSCRVEIYIPPDKYLIKFVWHSVSGGRSCQNPVPTINASLKTKGISRITRAVMETIFGHSLIFIIDLSTFFYFDEITLLD